MVAMLAVVATELELSWCTGCGVLVAWLATVSEESNP